DAHPGHTGVAKGLLGEAEDLVAPHLHPSRPIRLAVNGDGARGSLALSGEDLDHLGLAVAGNAGDPHDLPGVDGERDVHDGLVSLVVVDSQVVEGETYLVLGVVGWMLGW